MAAIDTEWMKLRELIKDIKFGMLTVRHGDGTLRSRPMTTQKDDGAFPGTLWFFASRKGEPALDIGRMADVNVAYADPGKDAYVSVAGRASIVEDMGKKRELWTSAAQAWFPGGPADPDLALVSVVVDHAEYWDVKASHVMQLLRMAKAAVTGERARLETEHGELRRA